MEGRRGLSTPTTQICISFDDIRGWLGNLRKIMSMMGMQCVQANDVYTPPWCDDDDDDDDDDVMR